MKIKNKKFSRFICFILTICMVITYFPVIASADDNTEIDLDSILDTLESDTLYCGAAVRDITPTSEMYPLERKAAGDLVGVIDPLHVRVIAISDGETTSLILSFETGRGPYAPQYVPALAKYTGVAEGNIFFTATHSHACPEITSYIDLESNTNYAKWGNLVMDQMLAASEEAIANLEPAEVGIGYADSYTNVNRSAYYTTSEGVNYREIGFNGSGYSDKLLTAIQFNSLDTGNPIAFIISHATHGVVMHANEYFDDAYEGINYDASEKYATGVLGVSSDLPGYVSTYLEENYEGSVALYLCGAAGDQNPIVMNEVYTANPATGEQEITHIAGGSVEILEYLARIQYQDVLTALSTIEEFSTKVAISNAFGATDLPAKAEGADDITMHLQLLRIGDIALVGNAGELFNSIGVYMRENSLLENTLVVNCCWNNSAQTVAYFADDDALINGGAMATAKYAPGYVNEYMTALMNELIESTESDWTYNGDGTATHNTTNETVIVGLDGVAGTEDDNRVVNPAGTVLLEGVLISSDAEGTRYVSLGNGFKLYAGDDGLLGTTDDIVKGFGSYQQNLSDDATTIQRKEDLDWRLLDIEDGQAKLMTKYIVDGVQYNLNASDGNAWVDSNLRSWLNSSGGQNNLGDTTGFYNTAFSDAEKEKIVLTNIDMNSDSSFIANNTTKSNDWWEYYTTTGDSTTDYVWALSGEEAFEYYGLSKIATEAELGHDPQNYTNGYFIPTVYANLEAKVKVNSGGNGKSFIGYGDSWTRSPGRDVDENGTYYGVFWGSVGSLNSGRAVSTMYGALPAITVYLGQDDSDWIYNGDGTATNNQTSEVVIVGLDEVAGTADDNKIVNPAETVLLENVEFLYDSDGKVYVELGNGFNLYGGADGLIGTGDDIVYFGSYAQSDDTGATKEALEWRILDIQNGEAVLLSAKVVDAAKFNLNATDGNSWAESNLRNWLNSDGGESNTGDTDGFYDKAFSDADKEKINLTEVRMDFTDWTKWDKDGDEYNYQGTTGNYPGYDRVLEGYELYTTTGESSSDYVYAISGEEVFQYFETSTIMNPEFYDLVNFTNGYFPLTAYALSQGAKYNSSALQWMFNGNADSWTRSAGRAAEESTAGDTQYYGTFWGSYGNMNTGRTVNTTYGVLPMINVSLDGTADTQWTYNGDGTATHNASGETVIVGLDGKAGTEDDNKVVNPAGKVLVEDAVVSYDSEGIVYVALGNDFSLYGGEDGLIGTGDDIIAGFGSYPQSDATGETQDPINWRLLDIEDGEAVLISEHSLDAILFNLDDNSSSNAWKDSNLRSWLNSRGGTAYNAGSNDDSTGFYDTAFTDAEKQLILLSDIKMDYSDQEKWDTTLDDYNGTTGTYPAYDRVLYSDANISSPWVLTTTTGESTKDYVYAISGEEYFEYFGAGYLVGDGWELANYRDGYFTATEYAKVRGAKNSSTQGLSDLADSWARSPGREDLDSNGNAYGVFWSGTGSMNVGREVNNSQSGKTYGIIPMINVNLGEIADSEWTYNGDGTATNITTGEIVIVGLDGKAGTEDDNRIVNPAEEVLIEDVELSYDADGTVYVDLGNGFNLYGGADGLIGTYDDVVKGFGSYAQSDTTGATKEALNWRLLDIQDEKAILIADTIIDGIKFNLNATDGNAWAGSNLRSWLNSTGGENSTGDTTGFYDTAFTDEEKSQIASTNVNMNSDSSFIAYDRTKTTDWWEYYTTTGESTTDYVWALSGEETFKYFGQSKIATEDELGHNPANYTDGYFLVSDYAQTLGVKINTGGNGDSFIGFGDSWTRSPGRVADDSGNYYGVFWGSVGSLNSGRPVNTAYGALPAITVNLGESEPDPETYTLTFETNGGTAVGSIKAEDGTVINLTQTSTRDGYTFGGWYSDVNLTNKVTSITLTADTTVYAKWVAEDVKTYTLTFETNGGTAIGSITDEAGTVVELTQTPTRDGYTFVGWYSEAGLNNRVESITLTADTTVYAKWVEEDAETYTLTFETNGGTVVGSITDKVGTVIELSQTPTKEGYTFAGWYSDTDLTNKVESITLTTDTTVYAKWTPIPELNATNRDAYIQGYDDGKVRPEAKISREEVAMIFYRLLTDESREHFEVTENNFTDVKSDRWSNTAISTLANIGVLEGYGDGTFLPGEPITRAELVKIVQSFEVISDASILNYPFSDIEDHWAEEFIIAASISGWINGYGDETFKPDNDITRAETIKIVNLVLGREESDISKIVNMKTWTDNADESAWYYKHVQIATNSYTD